MLNKLQAAAASTQFGEHGPVRGLQPLDLLQQDAQSALVLFHNDGALVLCRAEMYES